MATMQEKPMRVEQAEELPSEMSIEGISSPIAQHILEFYDDGGRGELFPIDHSSSSSSPPLPVSSSPDMPDRPNSTTPDADADAAPTTDLGVAFSNFKTLDKAAIDTILETPIPSDNPPSDESQPPHLQQQQQQPHIAQQSVPGINYNSLLLQSTQSLNMSSTTPQFLMKPTALPASLVQVPMQMQQPGGIMGMKSSLFPLQMAQQNNTDHHQRFFRAGGSSSNGLPIDLEGVISPFASRGGDQLRRILSTGDLQGITGSQNVMAAAGACNESNSSPVLASTEPTAAAFEESSSYKVGRLTQEERKAKIDRYIRKRNERNFKKKIKYACRKTLADSRPRVRGRFAKNDELDEPMRRTNGNGSYDEENGTSSKVPTVKEGEDINIADIQNSGTNYRFYNWTPNPSWNSA